MNSAASGAADFPPAASDNSAGRRQQRAPAPGRIRDGASKPAPKSSTRPKSTVSKGGKKTKGVNDGFKTTEVSEGEIERCDVAAVHPDGAETDANRADAARREDDTDRFDPPTDSPSRRSPLRLSCLRGKSSSKRLVSDHPDNSSAGLLKGKAGKRGGEELTAEADCRRKRSGEYVGCGPGLGFWTGGCLQTELIQFHLHKRLKRNASKMHPKTASAPETEAETEPATEATEAGSVTQQDQALQDEMERLMDENDDLKV